MEEVLLTYIALPIVRTEGAKRMTNYLEVFLSVSIRAIRVLTLSYLGVLPCLTSESYLVLPRSLTLSYLFQLTTDYQL